jgi:hypothetical protein
MSHRMIRPLVSLASATSLALVLAATAGCEAEVAPAGPPVVYAETTAGPAGPGVIVDSDVVYEQDAPVVDIDTYPTTVYGGVSVYYVGGMWYRHDDHGWGYYRQEPRELAQQREAHASDPRWVAARERQPSQQRTAEPRQAAVPPPEAARPEARPEEAARPAEEPKAGAPGAQRTVKRPAPRPKPEPERR